jgi:hypothetical protein
MIQRSLVALLQLEISMLERWRWSCISRLVCVCGRVELSPRGSYRIGSKESTIHSIRYELYSKRACTFWTRRVFRSRKVQRHKDGFEMLVVAGEMRLGVLNRVGPVNGMICWV